MGTTLKSRIEILQKFLFAKTGADGTFHVKSKQSYARHNARQEARRKL
jgi:hypothetical protein